MKTLIGLLALLAWLVVPGDDRQADVKDVAITGVTVVDVAAGRDLADQTVVIHADRIAKVGPRTRVGAPRGAQLVDGTGMFVIPGLWDMHGHLFSNSHKPGTDDHAWHFPLYVATGVTGVRDMWTNLDEIPTVRRWMDDRAAGRLLAPRVAVTGPMVNGPDGILRNVIVVTSADDARQVVDRLAEGGAQAVKIHARVPREAYLALMARASERHIPVVGHVPAFITVREAIAAGQHSIEHMNGIADGCASAAVEAEAMRLREGSPAPGQVQQLIVDGYDEARCQDLLRMLAAAHLWQVPTQVDARLRLAPSDAATTRAELRYVPAAERDDWDRGRGPGRAVAPALAAIRKRVFLQQQQLVGMMQRAGVPIMTGTDVSNPWIVPGFSVHDELALLVEAGLSPAEALRAATLSPARYLGMTDVLGSIAAGKAADLVLLDADPLADIHNSTRIRAVFVNGRYEDRAALDRLLADLARNGR
jgi:imidazolonepropionase-like amidohydrolase